MFQLFSLECKNDLVVIYGYGHGLGLYQQAAIEMASQAVNYVDIIEFYYTNTCIIHYSELH